MHTPAVMSHDLNQAGKDWRASPLGLGLASAVEVPAISDQRQHGNNLCNALCHSRWGACERARRWVDANMYRAATVSCQQLLFPSMEAVNFARNTIV